MKRNTIILVAILVHCLFLCAVWYTAIQNDKYHHFLMVKRWDNAIKAADNNGIVEFNGKYYTIERAKIEQRLHALKTK